MKDIYDILREFKKRRGENFALATLVRTEGSSYRRPGARMLICEDGTTVGSLSAGCLESDVAECAREVLRTGQSVVVSFDTRRRFGVPARSTFSSSALATNFLPSLRKTIKPGVSKSQLRALKERSLFRRFLRHFAC